MGLFSNFLDWIFGPRPRPQPVPPPAPLPTTPTGDPRSRMLATLNGLRARAGVSVLREDVRLTHAAQTHASALAEGRIDPHEDFPGRIWLTGFPQLECGVRAGFGNVSEAVCEGTAPLEACLAGLMDHAEHERDLTDPLFTLVGLGFAVGRAGMAIYVIDYGTLCANRSPSASSLMPDTVELPGPVA
jgi:uncharacterized protein YkwD